MSDPRRRRLAAALGLALLALVFIVGLTRLFALRFEGGDVLPPYSSLRADPLGTKVLHDSLEEMAGVRVLRSFRPLGEMDFSDQTAVVTAGMRYYYLDAPMPELARELESAMTQGARLIIALRGTPAEDTSNRGDESEAEGEEEGEPEEKVEGDQKPVKEKDKTKEDEPEHKRYKSLEERWGFKLLNQKDVDIRELAAERVGPWEAPLRVAWRSALAFEEFAPAWRVIYTCNQYPVIMERSYGNGSVVLLTDAYLLSNESLITYPEADFLASLIGPARLVVFNEDALGIQDNPGVVALARKYRLHGLGAGLLVLTLLFIWRNSTSLAPRRTDPAAFEDHFHSERDSTAGLVSLLRRNIPPGRVLDICLDTLRRTLEGRRTLGRDKLLAQAQQALEAERPKKGFEPAAVYRKIHKILAEGDPTWNKTPRT